MTAVIDAIDHQILYTLADGEWESGTTLAAACAISRAALAKRIHKLQALDFMPEIQSRHGKGYCLPQGLDLLEDNNGAPRPPLGDIPGLVVLRSCDSTSAVLLSQNEHQVVLAEHQTQGRGRRGRQWQAPYAQNILLSLRYRYPSWPENIASLSLVLGMAVVRLLREQQIPAGIKWPNDIWLDGRKLGGILVDTRGEASSGCELIVGCGLNVHMRAAENIDQPWSSLSDCGYSMSRASLSGKLVNTLQTTLETFGQESLRRLPEEFSQWDVYANQRVVLLDSRQQIEGVQRGITAHGALRLERPDGAIDEFFVGDLSLRKKDA